MSESSSPPPFCGMQLVFGAGAAWVAIVSVFGGGGAGGGGAACVVIVSVVGGGGGGGGAVVWVATAVAAALCEAALVLAWA